MKTESSEPFYSRKGFTIGNFITVITTLMAIGVASGHANARLDEAFVRIEKIESKTSVGLAQLQKDLSEIKVQLARAAQDLEWIKNREKEQE